ncbi:MAG: hypothetical protein OH335_05280, partial [Candidatus Parvarchaeota archaeon]|nr:hypothetical protein [Candidatus Jingweiarchaeum tengchongense]
EASKILKEDEKVIEELAKVLHENELLELVYPANPFVQPFIRIKKKEVKKEEKKIEKKPIGRKISLKIPISLDKIKEIIIKPKKFEPEKKKVK